MKSLLITFFTLISVAAFADSTDCYIQGNQINKREGVRQIQWTTIVDKNEGLPSEYEPQTSQIPHEWMTPVFRQALIDENEYVFLQTDTLRALLKMLNAAKADGIELFVHSGYRSFKVQCSVFSKKVAAELKAANSTNLFAAVFEVNKRSAIPGQSEHQLGTTMDLVTNIPGIGYQLVYQMEDTPAYKWLQKNAHNYGFILSFPYNNKIARDEADPETGYIYEPWHWRYVTPYYSKRFKDCGNMTSKRFFEEVERNPRFSCR